MHYRARSFVITALPSIYSPCHANGELIPQPVVQSPTQERTHGMLYVMVSLDLEDAEAVRYEFNALLESSNWVKLKKVDTVWSFQASNHDQSQYESVKKYITDKLMKGAKEFRIKGITAVAQIGNAKVFGHQIVLKNGVHVAQDFNPYV